MNKNKIFFLFVGLLSLVLASCSDDDYKWATPESEQVYFSKDLGSTVNISPNANSVSIPVKRINTQGAVTVPLTVTGATGTPYTVPTSVSFADGASEANIDITYDPSQIGSEETKQIQYGDYKNISIAIGDSTYSTSYGKNVYAFQIGISEWSDWKYVYKDHSAKEPGCTYYYSQYLSGSDTLTIYQRDNLLDNNIVQYKVSHWFDITSNLPERDENAGVDLLISYNKSNDSFTVEPQNTGYHNSNYNEDVYVASYDVYMTEVLGRTVSSPHPGHYDKESGIMTIPLVYYISQGAFGVGNEYIYLDGYNRADYSTDVAYLGKLTNEAGDPTKVYFNVTLGKNVESANVAVVPGAAVDSTTMAHIIDGSYTPMSQTTASGEVSVDASSLDDGQYTVVVVPFADNVARTATASSVQFNFTKGASEWESLGTGKFVDDIVGSLYFVGENETFNPSDFTFNVEIQASTKTKGLYRLVDPFAPYAQYGSYDTSSKHYLEINAVNPNGVYIETQKTGLTLSSGDGEIGVESMGAYYLDQGATVDDIIANGVAGTLSNGTITFPAKGILAILSDGAYYANPNGATRIVLPSSSSAKRLVARQLKSLHKKAVKSEKVRKMHILHKI